MKIAVGIVCWIEDNKQLPELKRCLDSLKDFDEVIVVNGKWGKMEGINQHSTKEVRQLIESYPNVIHKTHDGLDEWEARNIYLETTKSDYLIMLDTDEWIELPNGRESLEKELGEIFNTEYSAYTNINDLKCHGFRTDIPKIIRDPINTRHTMQHNKWYHNGVLSKGEGTPLARPPDSLLINHDKTYRSESTGIRMCKFMSDNPIH